jgi:hypothetical protein
VILRIALAIATVSAAGLVAVPTGASGLDRTLTARGAIVQPPKASVTKLLQPDQGCQVLLDAGTGDCAVLETAHGTLVFTIEAGPYESDVLVSRPWTVRVYRSSKAVSDGEEVGLETRPQGTEPGPVFAGVTAKTADVSGDGKPELLIGYRSEGTGQFLDVDIVSTKADGAPVVLAHERLDHGVVKLANGHFIQYTPVYEKGDANCCPTFIERDTVRWRNGAFHVERGPRVPTKQSETPPGDLG